jgi:hypothetical protein
MLIRCFCIGISKLAPLLKLGTEMRKRMRVQPTASVKDGDCLDFRFAKTIGDGIELAAAANQPFQRQSGLCHASMQLILDAWGGRSRL